MGLLGNEGKPRLCGDTGVKNPGKKLQMDFTAGPVATTACKPLQVAHLVCGSPPKAGARDKGLGDPPVVPAWSTGQGLGVVWPWLRGEAGKKER